MASRSRAVAAHRVDPPTPIEHDLVLLLQACTAAIDDRVLADVRTAAGHGVRYSDSYVFQHLLAGPLTVSELARRLGVSQQAASKHVADMERRGLAARADDPADGRARLVAMSPRAWRAVEAARTSRQSIAEEIGALLGANKTRDLLKALGKVSDATGALDRLRGRELRPEGAR